MNGHCGLVNTHVNALAPWKILLYMTVFGLEAQNKKVTDQGHEQKPR